MTHPSPLSRIELLILLSIGSEALHGYEIMQRIQVIAESKQKLGAGTLYVAIKRLVDSGYLTEDISRRSTRRRYYTVSNGGRAAVAAKLDSYESILQWAHNNGWAQ